MGAQHRPVAQGTVAECDAIKREAVAGRRATVVGMGFIGCEVAASLTQLGLQVTAVFPGSNPLERVLGTQIGALIGAMHRANGVRLLAGAQVAAFKGAERLEVVVLADGERVGCDFAVVGVGIDPEVPAVGGASMAQDNGILVDERCRTSAADIDGAGDVANHLHPVLGRIRVEHYHSADHHGAAAARSMLSSAAPVGLDRGGDPEWEPESEMAACARLVARRVHPDRGVLTDERTDLWSLAR